MTRTSIMTLAALALLGSLTQASGAEPTVVSGGDTTLVYVFPTSPQTFVPVQGLPSFLVIPGANAPAIATQVVYTVPQPSVGAGTGAVADLDCSNFVGTVTISGPDIYNLDKDGDGVGCEPEDRT